MRRTYKAATHRKHQKLCLHANPWVWYQRSGRRTSSAWEHGFGLVLPMVRVGAVINISHASRCTLSLCYCDVLCNSLLLFAPEPSPKLPVASVSSTWRYKNSQILWEQRQLKAWGRIRTTISPSRKTHHVITGALLNKNCFPQFQEGIGKLLHRESIEFSVYWIMKHRFLSIVSLALDKFRIKWQCF